MGGEYCAGAADHGDADRTDEVELRAADVDVRGSFPVDEVWGALKALGNGSAAAQGLKRTSRISSADRLSASTSKDGSDAALPELQGRPTGHVAILRMNWARVQGSDAGHPPDRQSSWACADCKPATNAHAAARAAGAADRTCASCCFPLAWSDRVPRTYQLQGFWADIRSGHAAAGIGDGGLREARSGGPGLVDAEMAADRASATLAEARERTSSFSTDRHGRSMKTSREAPVPSRPAARARLNTAMSSALVSRGP